MLGRPITTIELIQINKFFSSGRGYKDLIRDFKKCFNVDLPKPVAKQFMLKRSWSDVLLWLTGEHIIPDNDSIPCIESKRFELLEQMLEISRNDSAEQETDLQEFEQHDYYIPEDVKFFNFPLFGEIITYKYREPFIKCFLFETRGLERRRLSKIEDIPISDELPSFLLRILKKINSSKRLVSDINSYLNDPNYAHLIQPNDDDFNQLTNIMESNLFKKYNIVAKT